MAATDGKVVLGLTMDDKGATGKMTGVTRKYKEIETAVNKTAAATGRLARTSQKQLGIQQRMGRMMAGLGGMVGGYVGLYSLQRVLSSVLDTYQKFSDKRKDFEKSITPLLSLGDNANRIGAVKKEVVGMSNAWGRATEEVADFKYFLESGTAGFSVKLVQQIKNEALELSAATGSELKPTVDSMIKTWQIYGNEIESVNALQNKLFYSIREGYLAAGDVAEQMPRFLPAGKALGLTLDQQLAMMIELSKVTGSVEEAALGVRNIPMIMEEAQKKGVKFFGTWQEKLVQLNKYMDANRTKMLELFGRRVFTVAAGASQKVSEIEDHVRKLGDLTDSKNLAGETIYKRLSTDLEGLLALQREQVDQGYANAPLGSGSLATSQKYLDLQRGKMFARKDLSDAWIPLAIQEWWAGGRAVTEPGFAASLERRQLEEMVQSGEYDKGALKASREHLRRRELAFTLSQVRAKKATVKGKLEGEIGWSPSSWFGRAGGEDKDRLQAVLENLERQEARLQRELDIKERETTKIKNEDKWWGAWKDAASEQKDATAKQAEQTADNTQAVKDNTLTMLEAKRRIASGADSVRGGITKANPAGHVRGRMPPGLHSAYGLMRGQEMHSAYYPDKGQIVYDAYGRKVRPRNYNIGATATTQTQTASIPYANLARIPKKKRDPNWVKSRLAPTDTLMFDLWKSKQPAQEPTYFDEWKARQTTSETPRVSAPKATEQQVIPERAILELTSALDRNTAATEKRTDQRPQRRPMQYAANAQGGA